MNYIRPSDSLGSLPEAEGIRQGASKPQKIGKIPSMHRSARRGAMLGAIRLWSQSTEAVDLAPFSYIHPIDLSSYIPAVYKEEYFTTKTFKPPRYKDLIDGKADSEMLKVIAMQLHYLEAGGYEAFTLNPSKDVLEDARRYRKGMAAYFQDSISRNLRKQFGHPIKFWFFLEATDFRFEAAPFVDRDKRTKKVFRLENGKIHLHGAFQISSADKGKAKKALRATNKNHSVPFSSDINVGGQRRRLGVSIAQWTIQWAIYASKHIFNTRRNHLPNETLFAADQETRREAAALWDRLISSNAARNALEPPREANSAEDEVGQRIEENKPEKASETALMHVIEKDLAFPNERAEQFDEEEWNEFLREVSDLHPREKSPEEILAEIDEQLARFD